MGVNINTKVCSVVNKNDGIFKQIVLDIAEIGYGEDVFIVKGDYKTNFNFRK